MNSRELRQTLGAGVERRTVALPLSERKVALFLIDGFAAWLALLLILHWRFGLPLGWETLRAHPGWFLLLVGLWAVCAPLLNAYDLRRASRLDTGVTMGGVAAGTVALLYLAIPYITPPLNASRLTAGTFAAASVGLVCAGRAVYALLLAQPTFRRRVVIVGAGWAGRTVLDALRSHAPAEYEPLGFIDDDPGKHGEVDALPVVGTARDLRWIVREGRVSELILAITHHGTMAGQLVQALMDSHEQGVQITAMTALYERLTGRVPVEHAGSGLHVVLPLDRDPSLAYLTVKRGMDLAAGIMGTILMLPLLPLVAIALRLEGPGPIFIRQSRLGRGGRPFVLVKFRTMVPDAEADGVRWAAEKDRRVTHVGRWLRRLHLDEIPQAINLVRGEMSLIGPRPERPEFVAALEREIPFYRARHAMRPGITGWAQVNYRYGASTEDALIKLQYDLYYIKRCSLYLDLLILVRTFWHIMALRGR